MQVTDIHPGFSYRIAATTTTQVKQLKQTLRQFGRGDIADAAVEKQDLMDTTIDLVTKSLPDLVADKYDLVANITHDRYA